MDLKENLLNWFTQWASVLDENQLKSKIESTVANTFLWMWLTLFTSFGTAYYIYIKQIALSWGMFWWSMLWGFGLVFAISFFWQRLSYSILAMMLLWFWVLEWIGLSWVFSAYSMWSVYNAFGVTALMFLLLSFAGSVMKIDTTKIGSILFIWLIALIIWMVVNMFWWNQTFDIWLSVIWLIIFSWLVIYDMAVLKEMAVHGDNRVEIVMALSLFLNFINIFLFLLRLFGNKE